jgi:hypothetical protein
MLGEPGAGLLYVGLRDAVVTHDFEHEVPTLVCSISGTDQSRKRWVELKPAVRISVAFVPQADRLMVRLGGRITIVPVTVRQSWSTISRAGVLKATSRKAASRGSESSHLSAQTYSWPQRCSWAR